MIELLKVLLHNPQIIPKLLSFGTGFPLPHSASIPRQQERPHLPLPFPTPTHPYSFENQMISTLLHSPGSSPAQHPPPPPPPLPGTRKTQRTFLCAWPGRLSLPLVRRFPHLAIISSSLCSVALGSYVRRASQRASNKDFSVIIIVVVINRGRPASSTINRTCERVCFLAGSPTRNLSVGQEPNKEARQFSFL